MDYNKLFSQLDKLNSTSTVTESWGAINIKGIWQDDNDVNFSIINEELKKLNLASSYKIDEQVFVFEEFFENLFTNSEWELNINKISRLESNKVVIFYKIEAFTIWSNNLDCFDSKNPLIINEKIFIRVRNLNSNDFVIANNFIVTDLLSELDFSYEEGIPSSHNILSNVHIKANENFAIEPSKFFINKGEFTDLTKPFFMMCLKTLSVCLTSELINNETVLLRGIRKIEVPLYSNCNYTIKSYDLFAIKATIQWIYEDKTELKIKLFLDRFTLDLDLDQDYISEILKLNKNSIEQAKERYTFITFERKDQFQKELRDLLKDLKTLSDLYTTKVRNLLSNLLRDILAGLILIGITILSKVDLSILSSNSSIIHLVFKIFSIYFIISILYQSIFDLIDIIKTKQELIFWKKTSREYISERDFSTYLKETVSKRAHFAYIFYGVLIISYISLAYLSFNFGTIIEKHFSPKKEQVTNPSKEQIGLTKDCIYNKSQDTIFKEKVK